MINFEEELKKFHPSPEIEDISETIYNQDINQTKINTIEDYLNPTN